MSKRLYPYGCHLSEDHGTGRAFVNVYNVYLKCFPLFLVSLRTLLYKCRWDPSLGWDERKAAVKESLPMASSLRAQPFPFSFPKPLQLFWRPLPGDPRKPLEIRTATARPPFRHISNAFWMQPGLFQASVTGGHSYGNRGLEAALLTQTTTVLHPTVSSEVHNLYFWRLKTSDRSSPAVLICLSLWI